MYASIPLTKDQTSAVSLFALAALTYVYFLDLLPIINISFLLLFNQLIKTSTCPACTITTKLKIIKQNDILHLFNNVIFI